MAFYADEEEVWNCPQHPSKRRRSGICPICLRDSLNTLCPDCANLRPCECCTTTTTTTTTSSSFSIFFGGGGDASRSAGVGAFGSSVSNLIDSEPAFPRSRSVAIPLFRSRFAGVDKPPAPRIRSKSSFWSVFRTPKNKKGEEEEGEREDEEAKRNEVETQDDYAQRMMMRSRSVSVTVAASDSGVGDVRFSSAKGRGWYFPSPIKVFRHSKTSKVVQERSPSYRG